MKGAYLLVMTLTKETSIVVGKHGLLQFQKGCYAYVGSALNGLEQRIQRHLRSYKKIYWHIDYLLPYAGIVNVFYIEANLKEECGIARVFEKKFTNIHGFGCSDCACTSHLFYGSYHDILRVIESLNMTPYPLYTNP